MKRLKYLCEVNPSIPSKIKDDLGQSVSFYPMESIPQVGLRTPRPQQKALGDVIKGYTYFANGDIVFAKVTPCLENGKMTLMKGLINEIGFGSTELIVLRSIAGKCHPNYLKYVISSDDFRNHAISQMYGAGGLKRVSESAVKNFFVAVINPHKQRQIAAYLNRETAKIDNLISKQKKLIALLKEKRQAVISQAVTKGLDPNAKMKDSGVDWLGDVPQHWSVKKLKYVCRVTTGNKDTQDAVDDGLYPFFVRSQTVERIDSYSFDGEGVLTAGDGAGVGKVFHYHKGKLAFHQRVYLLYGFNDYSAKLMFHHLREHFYNVALGGQAKSTVDSLRMPIFLNFEVPVPTENEQIEILKTVEQIDHDYQKTIEKSEQSIALLQERRQALITAAVTGKIDIRDLVTEEEVASLDAEIEQDDFDVDSEVEDLDEPEMASEE